MGAIGKCCCGCEIDSDNFNRPDSSTLGVKWEDYSTAWEVDNEQALATSIGIARFDVVHPVPDESMVVYYETIDEINDSGTKYRVLVNVLDDENYHFAEFTRLGANDSTLALGVKVSGTETIIKTETITGLTSDTRKLTVKFADNEFCATASNTVLSFVGTDPTPIANGYYSGIERVNDEIRIDNFVFEHHRQTKEECDSCLCQCEGNYIPPTLTASLTGTGRMSGLTADMTLTWNRLNSRWESNSETHCSTTWQLFFNCPTDELDGGTATLVINLGCTNSDGFGTAARLPDSHDCDLLTWTFGSYNVSALDFACGCGLDFTNSGTYTIVISLP